MNYSFGPAIIFTERDEGKDLSKSYDKSTFTNRKFQKANWQDKTQPKPSITQQSDQQGLSDKITTAAQYVVTPAYGIPTIPFTTKPV